MIFSNLGGKIHPNPNPTNFSKKEMVCLFVGCTKKTKATFGFCPDHSAKKFTKQFQHLRDWIGELRYTSSFDRIQENLRLDKGSPLLNAFAPPHVELTEYLLRWAGKSEAKLESLDTLVLSALKNIVGNTPDATSLQLFLEGKNPIEEQISIQTTLHDRPLKSANFLGFNHPDLVVNMIKDVTEESLPEERFELDLVDNIRIKFGESEFMTKVPVRIIGALLVTAWACEEINRGDLWFRKAHNFQPDKPKRASAYMSATYYFMRRFAGCLEAQARIIVRSMS